MQIPKNRWSAFAIHFGISLLVFFALLVTILCFWYPGALFPAAGGWQGIRIVIGVDLVLGPLLTLIVYNLTKPRRLLYRDLAVVAVIQFSCLAAGVAIVYSERPVAVIYSVDKFYALKRSEFVANGKNPDSLPLRLMTPTYFQVKSKATTLKEAKLIEQLQELTGKGLLFRTDLYQPLPRTLPEASKALGFDSLPPPSGCPDGHLATELLTVYAQGTVCFDPARQRLEKFIAK